MIEDPLYIAHARLCNSVVWYQNHTTPSVVENTPNHTTQHWDEFLKLERNDKNFVKKSCLKMTWHCKNNSLLVKKVDTLTMSIKEIGGLF